MGLKPKGNIWQIRLKGGTISNLDMDGFRRAFARKAFRNIDNDPSCAVSTGFVPFLDEDGDVGNAEIMFGTSVLVSLRTDSRKIDAKVANVLLARSEKKEGRKFGKKERKERLDYIKEDMLGKAIPTPSVQPLILVPEADVVYVAATASKKADETAMLLLEALGRDTGDVEFAPMGGEEAVQDALTSIWHKGELGHLDFEFEPKSVAGESGSTSSSDAQDLSYGCVNGKKCASGKITFENGAEAIVRGKNASGIAYDFHLGKEAMQGEDVDAMLAQMIHEHYEKVREAVTGESACDDAAVRRDFGRKIAFSLKDE